MKKNLVLFILFSIFLIPLIIPASALALININTADATLLDQIPEVGPATASKIIEYRTSSGPFKTIADIMNVSGIKDATFAKMRDYITVDPTDSSSDQATSSDNTGLGDNSNGAVTDSDGGSSSDSGDDLSTHSDPVKLSDYVPAGSKVGAGRSRQALVKTPINFSASNDTKTDWSGTSFSWSFGDGSIGNGKNVNHSYEFAGNYNVVLNARKSDGVTAVSRTVISVGEPELKISDIDPKLGFIEIENSGNNEKNINGWMLKTASSTYVFPLDTIISKQAKIKFPAKNLGINLLPTGDIALLTAGDGTEFSRLSFADNTDTIKELQQRLDLLKQQLKDLNMAVSTNDNEVATVSDSVATIQDVAPVVLPEPKPVKIVESPVEQIVPSSTEIIVNKPKSWLAGIWGRLF